MSCWFFLQLAKFSPLSQWTDVIRGQTDFFADEELRKLQDADNPDFKVFVLYQTNNSDSLQDKLSFIADEELGKLQDTDNFNDKVQLIPTVTLCKVY